MDKTFICKACRAGVCRECIDILLLVIGSDTKCECKLASHNGEPVAQQVLDPFTGTVHAPGLEVKEGGSVYRTCKADGD